MWNSASSAGPQSGTRHQKHGSNANNGEGSRLARFSCWCPKVMAAIGRLPETLADRCVVITMQRKGTGEFCERLKNLEGSVLRRKCLRFAMDHAEEISAVRSQPARGLNDRAADIWEPLLALADLAGGEWPKLARDAAAGLNGGIGESNVIGQLLIHICAVFSERGVKRIFSRELVEELNAYRDRPWTEGLKKPMIDEVWLGRRLSKYGVRSKTIWINGESAKGYLMTDLEPVFRRYITAADLEELRQEPEEESANDPRPTGIQKQTAAGAAAMGWQSGGAERSTNNQALPTSRDSEGSSREAAITKEQARGMDDQSSTVQAATSKRAEENTAKTVENVPAGGRPWRRINGV